MDTGFDAGRRVRTVGCEIRAVDGIHRSQYAHLKSTPKSSSDSRVMRQAREEYARSVLPSHSFRAKARRVRVFVRLVIVAWPIKEIA